MKTLLNVTLATIALVAPYSVSHAQTVAPVPAPTIINSVPYTINAAGYYQLGGNLVYSATSGNIITINANNVMLDFAGHYIAGPNNVPSSTLYGVYSSEHSNLIIRNGTVAYCYEGIYLLGNGSSTSLNYNHRVDNMLLSHCYYEGINLYYATNSSVKDCSASFIGGNTQNSFALGIHFTYGSGNSVESSTVTNVDSTGGISYGIYTSGSGGSANNNKVSNVTVNGSTASSSSNGINGFTFANGDTVYNAYYGFNSCTKYLNCLTASCNTAFSGGTSVGGNSGVVDAAGAR